MDKASIARPLMILVAGPYRFGTGDDPKLISTNMDIMNSAALRILDMGHVPMLAEWVALPLIANAGSEKMGDEVFERIFNPVAISILNFCTAIVRVGGPSTGADEMMRIAGERHKLIFRNLSDIPTLLHVS